MKVRRLQVQEKPVDNTAMALLGLEEAIKQQAAAIRGMMAKPVIAPKVLPQPIEPPRPAVKVVPPVAKVEPPKPVVLPRVEKVNCATTYDADGDPKTSKITVTSAGQAKVVDELIWTYTIDRDGDISETRSESTITGEKWLFKNVFDRGNVVDVVVTRIAEKMSA